MPKKKSKKKVSYNKPTGVLKNPETWEEVAQSHADKKWGKGSYLAKNNPDNFDLMSKTEQEAMRRNNQLKMKRFAKHGLKAFRGAKGPGGRYKGKSDSAMKMLGKSLLRSFGKK